MSVDIWLAFDQKDCSYKRAGYNSATDYSEYELNKASLELHGRSQVLLILQVITS